MPLKWMPWPDCCPECGNDVEIKTDAVEGYCHDGDLIRCVDDECGFKSAMTVYEDGTCEIQEP